MEEHDKPGIIQLLGSFFGRHELRKQRAVWLAFGVNYGAEKVKQEAIWRQFQRKRDEKDRGRGMSAWVKLRLERRFIGRGLRASLRL